MCAAQITIASLATSDGWMTTGPTPSQFWLPFRSTPKNAVSSSNTSEIENPG
jgi:hypothetical protein